MLNHGCRIKSDIEGKKENKHLEPKIVSSNAKQITSRLCESNKCSILNILQSSNVLTIILSQTLKEKKNDEREITFLPIQEWFGIKN